MMRSMRLPGRWILVTGLVALGGCASTGPVGEPHTTAAPRAPDCRVARATGDVTAVLRDSGELVIVGGGVELLRSTDLGRSWRRERLPVDCRWPDAAEIGGRLVVSCSEPGAPGRLLVIREEAGGAWSTPVAVDATADLFIDTNLQPLPDGELVLFATHIDRADDLDHAVYTVQEYRFAAGAERWSEAAKVVTGRRGVHLEDTRSTVLDDGSVLLAYEIETAESAPSQVRQLRSPDGGRSWPAASVIWSGADIEPGGYLVLPDGELWFVASTDELAGGGSYDRASIMMRRSSDGGRSWSAPEVLVDREDQISFGGVVLPDGEVLLPSLRHYNRRKHRQLSIYLVDSDPAGGARCAAETLSGDDFEAGLGPQWRGSKNR
jgi:hypothetical protein